MNDRFSPMYRCWICTEYNHPGTGVSIYSLMQAPIGMPLWTNSHNKPKLNSDLQELKWDQPKHQCKKRYGEAWMERSCVPDAFERCPAMTAGRVVLRSEVDAPHFAASCTLRRHVFVVRRATLAACQLRLFVLGSAFLGLLVWPWLPQAQLLPARVWQRERERKIREPQTGANLQQTWAKATHYQPSLRWHREHAHHYR